MNTTLFKIRNLSSETASSIKPWEEEVKLPHLANKEAFRAWALNSKTDHVFVSGFEGINSHAAVSSKNVPFKMHGLIADYDCRVNDRLLSEGLARGSQLRPMFTHKTFSGGARVIWMFEEPVHVLPSVLKEFLDLLVKETKARIMLPRMDEAIFRPEQYYAWMPGVVKIADQPIQTKVIHSIFTKAVERSSDAGFLPKAFESTHQMNVSGFPPPIDMMRGLYSSVGDWAKSGFATAETELLNKRLDICGKCEKFKDGRCLLCGCFMKLKARLATGSCPLGKW